MCAATLPDCHKCEICSNPLPLLWFVYRRVEVPPHFRDELPGLIGLAIAQAMARCNGRGRNWMLPHVQWNTLDQIRTWFHDAHMARRSGTAPAFVRLSAAIEHRQHHPASQERAVLRRELREALDTLPPRWRQVLELRYGPRETSQKETGLRMGVTEARICQIERRAVETLREKLT